MKVRKFAVCLCVAIAATSVSRAEDISKTILNNENKIWSSFVGAHPDVNAFGQLVTADYLGIEPTGSVLTKAENIEELSHLTFSSFTIHDPQVRQISSNAALIVARVSFKGNAGPQDISGETLTSTVWVKRDGKWLAQLHTETFKK